MMREEHEKNHSRILTEEFVTSELPFNIHDYRRKCYDRKGRLIRDETIKNGYIISFAIWNYEKHESGFEFVHELICIGKIDKPNVENENDYMIAESRTTHIKDAKLVYSYDDGKFIGASLTYKTLDTGRRSIFIRCISTDEITWTDYSRKLNYYGKIDINMEVSEIGTEEF